MRTKFTVVGLGIIIFQAIVLAAVVFLFWDVLVGSSDDSTSIVTMPEETDPNQSIGLLSKAFARLFSAEEKSTSVSGRPLEFYQEQHSTSTPALSGVAPVLAHIVKPGDTLYRISTFYGVSLEAIMETNGIVDPRFIFVGQSILIPMDTAVASNNVTLPSPAVQPSGEQGDQSVIISATSTIPPTSPTLTSTTSATSSPTPTATSLPPPYTTVNGVPLENYLVLSEAVKENIREIYDLGQTMGRNPNAFSKVGDSTIENPHFLARFDEDPYVLGDYAYLQAVIDHFSGSFSRQGMAVRRGFHSWTVNDPMWADKSICLPNEMPIACEVRLNNPSVVLIRLGSNDRGVPAGFEQNLRQVVDYFIQSGIVPILGTKADRFEGPSNINNSIIRQVAADYQVPLWDFDLVAQTIPGRGLDVDGVHLTTFYAHDYTSPVAYQRGHGVHNLTALIVLDAVWQFLDGGSN